MQSFRSDNLGSLSRSRVWAGPVGPLSVLRALLPPVLYGYFLSAVNCHLSCPLKLLNLQGNTSSGHSVLVFHLISVYVTNVDQAVCLTTVMP